MQFQIVISIDAAGLNLIIQSRQSVVIAKAVTSSVPSPAEVAWLVFSPMETNYVTWEEEYMLYATPMPVQGGATVTMTSQSGPVQPGTVYIFQNGMFSPAGYSGAPTYVVQNEMPPTGTYSFGLAQTANLNGQVVMAPLNVVTLFSNESAQLIPQETLSIFLSSISRSGTILTTPVENALTITLSSGNPTAKVGFNDQTQTFYLIAG